MLILSRRVGERIIIDGGIVVMVAQIKGNQVRIGVEAPPHVGIYREELLAGSITGRNPVGAAAAL